MDKQPLTKEQGLGSGTPLLSPQQDMLWHGGAPAAQGGGLGGARVRGGISSFGFNRRPKTCPPMACAQRLFRRASTRDDGERMEICLQSEMQAAEKGDLPLIQEIQWIMIVES